MLEVPSSEFSRNFGRYREAAQRAPVAVTNHDRVTGYLISPQEFEEYQRQGAVSSRPSFGKKAKPLAVQEFEVLIDDIACQERVGRDEAMRRARQRHPEKFEAYQAA